MRYFDIRHCGLYGFLCMMDISTFENMIAGLYFWEQYSDSDRNMILKADEVD